MPSFILLKPGLIFATNLHWGQRCSFPYKLYCSFQMLYINTSTRSKVSRAKEDARLTSQSTHHTFLTACSRNPNGLENHIIIGIEQSLKRMFNSFNCFVTKYARYIFNNSPFFVSLLLLVKHSNNSSIHKSSLYQVQRLSKGFSIRTSRHFQ